MNLALFHSCIVLNVSPSCPIITADALVHHRDILSDRDDVVGVYES